MAKVKTGNSSKGIYILMESKGSNRYYVGSSMDLDTRFRSYTHKQRGKRIIDNSINKYGFDSFYKSIIRFNDNTTEKELRLWEKFYIGLFGSYHYENEDGMNLVNNPTLSPSSNENVKQKISIACKGLKKEWLSIRNKNNKYALGRHGEKHPMSKKVLILQSKQIFDSIQDAANYFNISRPAMSYRINKNNNMYKFI